MSSTCFSVVGQFLESRIFNLIKDSILVCPVNWTICTLLSLHSGKTLMIFSWTVSVFLEFSDIFLSNKVYRLPRMRILHMLAQGLQTRSEKFRYLRMEMPAFFKTSDNTTPRKPFLLEGLNRFSLDKYSTLWEKLPNFLLNEHRQTRHFSDTIPLYFLSR